MTREDARKVIEQLRNDFEQMEDSEILIFSKTLPYEWEWAEKHNFAIAPETIDEEYIEKLSTKQAEAIPEIISDWGDFRTKCHLLEMHFCKELKNYQREEELLLRAYKNYGNLILDNSLDSTSLLKVLAERFEEVYGTGEPIGGVVSFLANFPADNQSWGKNIESTIRKASDKVWSYICAKALALGSKRDWNGKLWEDYNQEEKEFEEFRKNRDTFREAIRWTGFPWEDKPEVVKMINEDVLIFYEHDECYYKGHIKERKEAKLQINFKNREKVNNSAFLSAYNHSKKSFCDLGFIVTEKGTVLKESNLRHFITKYCE